MRRKTTDDLGDLATISLEEFKLSIWGCSWQDIVENGWVSRKWAAHIHCLKSSFMKKRIQDAPVSFLARVLVDQCSEVFFVSAGSEEASLDKLSMLGLENKGTLYKPGLNKHEIYEWNLFSSVVGDKERIVVIDDQISVCQTARMAGLRFIHWTEFE